MPSVTDFYELLDREKNANKADSDTASPAFRQILPEFLPVPGATFLDIGCLDGSKTPLMARAIGAAEMHGVDFLPNRLAEAEVRGVRTHCVDLNNGLPMPYAPASFDVIHCGDVIEHVFSPDDLMDEIARLLKPGGYVLVSTPNLASWRNRVALLAGWQPFFSEVSTRRRYGNPLAPPGLPSGHIRMFAPAALLQLTEASGLRVERLAGGFEPSQSRTLISRLSRAVDIALAGRCAVLADRLIVRARKP